MHKVVTVEQPVLAKTCKPASYQSSDNNLDTNARAISDDPLRRSS